MLKNINWTQKTSIIGIFVAMKYIPVLSVAGSDCSGGAGIQADIKTMSALGCYAMSAITAVTAQNTCGVYAVESISPEVVAAQIDAVFDDIPPLAVKTGMLCSADIVSTVAERFAAYGVTHLVVDPVMVSTSGSRLISEEAIGRMVEGLFPLAGIVTPNVAEAEVLTSSVRPDVQADKILAMGPGAVLLKGGDRSGSRKTDLLYLADGTERSFSSPAVDTVNTHGTGCTLSSAIASFLARGFVLTDAVQAAKDYVTSALNEGARYKIGRGHGPVDHFYLFRR